MSVPAYRTPQKVRNYGQGTQNSNSSMGHTPFIQNPHAHPQFQPTRLLAKVNPDLKGNLKQPKAPDKPLMPYMRYSRKVWDSVKAKHQEMKLWEIGKIIGGMWREQTASEKAVFGSEYEIEKVQYSEQLKAYHNSAAYQEWIANKGRQDNEHGDDLDKRSKNQEHARVSIQPADEDDEFESEINTAKHLASARYQRNHQLINDILSNVLVPDVRMVVTSQRMVVLERQVDSLKQHQKKLEKELEDIDERHKLKKRKLEDSSAAFNKNLEKVIAEKAEMTSEQVEDLLQKTKEELRARHIAILEEEKQRVIEAEKEKIRQQELLELKIEEEKKIAEEKAIKEEEEQLEKEKQGEIDLKEKEVDEKKKDNNEDSKNSDNDDKKENDVEKGIETEIEGNIEKGDKDVDKVEEDDIEKENVNTDNKVEKESEDEKSKINNEVNDNEDGKKNDNEAKQDKMEVEDEKLVESSSCDIDNKVDPSEIKDLKTCSDENSAEDYKFIADNANSPKSPSPAKVDTSSRMEVDVDEETGGDNNNIQSGDKVLASDPADATELRTEDSQDTGNTDKDNQEQQINENKSEKEEEDDKEDYGEDTDPEDIPEDMEVEESEDIKEKK